MVIYAMLTSILQWITTQVPHLANASEPVKDMGLENLIYEATGLHLEALRMAVRTINTIFTADLLLRFLLCPERVKFLRQFNTLIDIFCLLVVCAYETVMVINYYHGGLVRERAFVANLILVAQVLRVLKITRLRSTYVQLEALLMSMRYSIVEINITLVLFLAVVSVFAVLVYQFEQQ